MIDSLLGWLNLTELGVYVIMTFVFMIALIFVEIYGLKNRRSRAYQALLREARARRSEMHLRID